MKLEFLLTKVCNLCDFRKLEDLIFKNCDTLHVTNQPENIHWSRMFDYNSSNTNCGINIRWDFPPFHTYVEDYVCMNIYVFWVLQLHWSKIDAKLLIFIILSLYEFGHMDISDTITKIKVLNISITFKSLFGFLC